MKLVLGEKDVLIKVVVIGVNDLDIVMCKYGLFLMMLVEFWLMLLYMLGGDFFGIVE